MYGSAFPPLATPVPLAVGDTVSVALWANLVAEDYVWQWNTRVLDQGHPGRVKANFHQSSFFGVPLSPARLRKRADSHVATLNEAGQVDRLILELVSDSRSLDHIARRVSAEFPTCFATWQDALIRVAELSEKYSR